jgi:hypothetical protein
MLRSNVKYRFVIDMASLAAGWPGGRDRCSVAVADPLMYVPPP